MRSIVFACLVIIFAGCQTKEHRHTNSFQYDVEPAEAGFTPGRLNQIDSLLSSFVKDGIMPNAVTFIARNGKVVHYKSYGWRNKEGNIAAEKTDIFRIASQTKGIVSVALMQLYEQGKFLLDDPVSMYIPEFKNPSVLENSSFSDENIQTRPAIKEITIRHLLSHTSGITYGNELYKKERIPIINSMKDENLEDVIKRLGTLCLAHDPGMQFTYGLNTDVLGYLIEVLSGMTLDEYLKIKIFEPLDMKDTYFYLPDDKVSRLVTLYSKDSITGPLYVSTDTVNQYFPVKGARKYFSGGAGLVGTIEDYAKFCQMLLKNGEFNGTRIIGRKTIELMTRNQIGEFEVWDSGNSFGLGFEIVTEKGAARLSSSVGAYGWGGMYSTDYKIDPTEDLIMLIYTNAFPFANPDINKRFRIMVYQALL